MVKYYLGLIVTIILSSLCWYKFSINIHGGSTGELPFFIPLLVPGISFSLFVTLCLAKRNTIIPSFTTLTTLCFCYFFIAVITLYTVGLIIPISGASGGALISFTLESRLKKNISHKKFIGYGLLATLPGFTLYFIDVFNREDVIFASITGLWQLVIGIIIIRELRFNQIQST